MHNNIIIFTDGSALGNPGKAGWGAVIISNKKEILEMGGFEKKSTNNRMEMTAVIESIKRVNEEFPDSHITIYTDSSYVVNGITKWIHGWILKGWVGVNKQPILNKDLWEELKEVSGSNIKWSLLPGHSGIFGNEKADEIATTFASENRPILYKGTIDKYNKNILDLSTNGISKSSKKNVIAYSYLSMVNGKIEKHKTWKECESVVKGKKDVKFKKSISREDEEKIIDEWTS
ncbi:MAG: ribonuclease HI [Parcubacteria group bacterium Athens0714_16]|nr:MAG: ribonuclease HI [Parcubacteria group bacterium Athens0714_16]